MNTSPLHPLDIWYRFRRGLPLLLIPLLRLLRGTETASAVLSASLWELTASTILLAWALLHHRHTRLQLQRKGLSLYSGILLCRRLFVPQTRVAAYATERSPLAAVTCATKLELFTANRPRTAVCSVTVPHRIPREKRARPLLFSRLFPTLLLAATGADAAIGLLALIPLVRHFVWISETLPVPLPELPKHLFPLPLPFILDRVADLLLLGWLFAFLRNLWYYAGFSLCKHRTHLCISTGLVTQRNLHLFYEHINALSARQTIFTLLCGFCTVSVSVNGYSEKEPVHPVIIPAVKQKRLPQEIAALFPIWQQTPFSVRLTHRAKLRYTLLPLSWIGFSLVLMAQDSLAISVGSLGVLFGAWWLAVRLVGWHRTGIGIGQTGMRFCYPRGLAVFEKVIKKSAIVRISLSQSWWQRRNGTCHLQILCKGDAHPHTVKALPYYETTELLKRFEE